MKKKSPKTPAKKTAAVRQAKRKSPLHVKKPFPIVGVGASAGGLEASAELLANLRTDLGMAYVFIHHLLPGYESNLAEILQRKTAMPVLTVKGSIKLEADHVYVIAPNTFMAVEDTQFKLLKRTKLDVPYHPVDYFFMSMAQAQEHKSIGILLSGTATDGTLGLKAIKESGGITFTQDNSAKHQQMPRNAQEAGYVDFVLSPQQIAQELASIVRNTHSDTPSEQIVVKNQEGIKLVLNIVMRHKGIDFFSQYKKSTIYRRIMRRMTLHRCKTLNEYIGILQENTSEVDALYHDFLINVTSFFREPEFYKILVKTVFPRVVKNIKQSVPIRMWIAGCATGEEAYSTAICLTEFLQEGKVIHPVNIFATDLNGNSIQKARLGIYPKNLLQHISPLRLKKFFVKLDGQYQVIKSIREMCIFSEHDLLKDPPFSRMDLVSCQNVLIYLQPYPQRKIFQAFHYALKPTGFLFMGKSESIGTATDLFLPLKKGSRVATRMPGVPQQLDFGSGSRPVLPNGIPTTISLKEENDVEKQSDKILLSRYVPASVLVNKDLGIMRFRGMMAPYLEPASGKASLNLLKMIHEELIFDVRATLQEAKKTGAIARRENIITDEGRKRRWVTIEAAPISAGKDTYYLVVFRDGMEREETGKSGKAPKERGQHDKIQRLEQALLNAREQIRATSEDFEGTREELQSANEEILSSNEELQSINEELETSKEELQSSNEELTTINEELQERNIQLKEARDYAEAIIHTIRGPLMVLNAENRIRTANRAFYEFFKLAPDKTDGVLANSLADGRWMPRSLDDRLREGIPGGSDFKDFTLNHDFPEIGNRTMIVNVHRLAHHDKQALTLFSFEDITRYKKAEQSLLETQEQLKLALDSGSVGTWYWNVKTGQIKISAEEEKLYGLPPGKTISTYAEWEKTIHPLDLASLREVLELSMKNRIPFDTEFRIVWPDGSVHWILAKANTYYDQLGQPERMVGVNIDITERRTAVEALAESEKLFHTMTDNAPVMIWMAAADKQITFLNKTWLSFTGKKLEEEAGEGWFVGIHPEDKNSFMEIYHRAFSTHEEFKVDYRLKRHDGEYRWIMTHGVPRFTANERLIGFIGTCFDITDRIDLERQKDDFMSIASHELKTPVTSIKAYAQILQEKFRKANDVVSANMLSRLDLQIDKLTFLINTLLDVAKMQSGQMDYVDEVFDIKDFILEIAEEIQRTSSKHKIVTRVKTEGQMHGDKARLGQVLSNLMSNAIKYSPDAMEVIVQVVKKNNDYIFSVQDFGVGIVKDLQEKVFGRFFRVTEASENRFSGLGLGLFISFQIIKQQGGKMWLESHPGKGSTFYFSLPVKK